MVTILDLDRRDPLVVSSTIWQGSERVDIRTHYYAKESDELSPTKKGVSLKIDEVPIVVQAVLDAYNQMTGQNLSLTHTS